MEINKVQQINGYKPNLTFQESKKNKANETKMDALCLDCMEASGRILANNPRELAKKGEAFVQNILDDYERIKKRTYIDDNEDGYLVFIQIGEPIEGFEDLYDDKKRACCIFDKNGNLR